ncbi:MAG: RNA polymerase sigma factor [Opitutae bacterium]|nr:RNA polymerase sigma factor [Opitutae bacterium]
MISATISQASATNHSAQSDEELASLARSGQIRAFDELVRRHWAGIRRFLLGYLPHGSSDDVAQETFLRAYRKIEQYDGNRPFLPWLFTISRRLALNEIRSKTRKREVSLPDYSLEKTPETEPPSFGPLWQLAKDRLSADSYAVLRLHYAEDLSIEEVAKVLGKGKIATKVMLHRARRKLSTFSEQLKDNYENLA